MNRTIIYEDRIYQPGEITLLDINEVMSGKEIFFYLKHSNEWLSSKELNQKLGFIAPIAPKKVLNEFSDRIITYKRGKKNRYFFLSSIVSDVSLKRNFSEEIKKEFEKLDKSQKKLFEEHFPLIDYMIYYKTGNYFDPGFFDVACLGLIKAVKIYNPNKGYKLPTHLCLYIGGMISAKLRSENKTFSLNDGNEIGDFINLFEDCIIKSPEEEFAKKELETGIEELLSNLKPNEREVIEKRFSVGKHKDKKPHTLEEIGGSLKRGKSGVHYVEKTALKKMKKDPISNRLKVYVEK